MEKELYEAKESLVDAPDTVEWLRLADRYIAQFNAHPSMFRLPKDHMRLKAVLENFAYDTDGWLAFVKQIRDEVHGSDKWESVHDFYRTVLARTAQQNRRKRLGNAVTVVESKVGKLTTLQKQLVAAWYEQQWGKQRLARMAEVRKYHGAKRLSQDERADVLENFWEDIDALLMTGDVPMPPEKVYDRTD